MSIVDRLDGGETPLEAWYWAVTSCRVDSDDSYTFRLRSGGCGGGAPVKVDPDFSKTLFEALERAATTGSFAP